MDNIKLINNGKCPFCKVKVYTPSQIQTSELACHIAVGMHIANCKENPDYKESDMDKFKREVLGIG